MANNLDSNITKKVMKAFLPAFESARVLTKTINTQMYQGAFTPEFGDEIYVKRPHDYRAIRTPGGDISQSTKNSIISGRAKAKVQDYITIPVEWTNKEEALELEQLTEILRPAAVRAVTELETTLGQFMIKNTNLRYGSPGTAVSSWEHVAGAGALMDSLGIPKGQEWYYAMNPFVATKLASLQNGLNAADGLVRTAWERAQISDRFGGLRAISSNALPTYTTGANVDLVGALDATPTATYVTYKDTMVMDLDVTGFGANAVVTAGTQIQVTGRPRVNMSTKQQVFDATGAAILWGGTVTEDVTLDGSGEGTISVAGPAINEANGQYNTVLSALTAGDVVTILGTASTAYQPNLFYHRDAFALATVKLPKLYSIDTVATTQDGFSLRVSKYADGDANSQTMRIDMLPAFGVMNPFFAGHGYGV